MVGETGKFQKDDLSYKFLLAKQIDRIGYIGSQMGYHKSTKETDLYSAVFFLQNMLYPYFENDVTKEEIIPRVQTELEELETRVENEGKEQTEYPFTMSRFRILMGFMARANLLLETRGRGR